MKNKNMFRQALIENDISSTNINKKKKTPYMLLSLKSIPKHIFWGLGFDGVSKPTKRCRKCPTSS